MTRGKQLLFAAILLIGTVAFLEVAASLFYYARLSEQERELVELTLELRRSDSNSVLRYVAHPYFNYVSNPEFRFKNGYQPHSQLGLRRPLCCTQAKHPGLIRIVAVGGSTTYGMYFSHERHVWPALLEAKLRDQFGPDIEVINAGVPNYTSYEMIGLLAMLVPEFSPDIVLLHIGLNDAFMVGYPDEGGPDNRTFRHAWSATPLPGWLARGMRASYTIRLLGILWASREGFSPGDMAGAIQYALPSNEEILHNAGQATGKYFRRNMRTLIALAGNIGAVPVLINMPLNPSRESGQSPYYTAVAQAVQRNNRIARDIAEGTGLLYIDLYSTMRDPAPFVDAAHVNQEGMEIKAALIAARLSPFIKELRKKKPRG